MPNADPASQKPLRIVSKIVTGADTPAVTPMDPSNRSVTSQTDDEGSLNPP